MEISESKLNPTTVTSFEQKILESVSSSKAESLREIKSIRKAFFAPLIWNNAGYVFINLIIPGLHSESTPTNGSFNRISNL